MNQEAIMRTWLTTLAPLFLAAAPLMAQRRGEEAEYRYALFIDGSTARGSTGSVLDNMGVGGSVYTDAFAHISLRATAAYDRVSSGNGNPDQVTSALGDVVFYPFTLTIVRVYAFGGLGLSHQSERREFVPVGNQQVTRTTSAFTYGGLDAGVGLELGGLFIQYRVPPHADVASSAAPNYNLISLGIRF
jgi:hypothetical protein